MSKNKKESFFWTSYSDLMTSLFFVMLLLFALTILLLHNKMVELEHVIEDCTKVKNATEEQLRKITELERSIQNINTDFFDYNDEYKTHILKTEVYFQPRSSKISDLSPEAIKELEAVRDTLKASLESFVKDNPDASYLLIIEGQASKDSYAYNNQLSYERALSLFKFWFPDQSNANLRFFDLPCEVIIAGAGCMDGKPRTGGNRERENQRFLIRILPKPGLIKSDNP